MEGRPLDYAAGPLVWIDCEMTGLNPRTDRILEIAVRSSSFQPLRGCLTGDRAQVIITNGNLERVDAGLSYIIKTDKEVLDKYVAPTPRLNGRRLESTSDTEEQNGRVVSKHSRRGSSIILLSFAQAKPDMSPSRAV